MFRRRLSCRFATLTAPSRHASTVPSGVDTTPVAIEPTLDATLDDETRHALLRIKPETPQRYLVEVANVSSAACRFCGLPVVSESLRIGALISSGSGDFTFPSFIHAECLTGGYRRAYPGAMRDWRLISGVARLPPSDIARVVDIVFGADHVIDPKQAKLLTKQSAALSMAEAALRDASAKEIAAMLVDVYGKPADKVFNMHPKGPSKPLVLSVLADALVFGPVEPCDACGSICKPTARGYECLGYIDEYTRCTNSRPTVKRLAGNAKWTALTKRFAVGHITDDCILHPRVLDAKSKPVEALATLPADSIDVFDGLHFDGFSPKDIAGLVSHGGNMIGKSDTRALPAHVVRRGPQASKSNKSIPATAPTVSDGWVHHCSKVGTTIHSPTTHKFFTANGPKKDPAEDLEKYIKLQRALHEEQVAKKTPNTTGAKERNVVVSSSGVAVDSEVPNAASYRVVVGSGGVPFHASLTKTDLASGRNSFYVLQLLVETTTNRYLVWRRWGRVGELIGGSKLEAGSETDFAKLFHERTGNNWPPNNFQKKAGLMDMVHVDYSVPSDDKGKKTNGKKGAKATGGGDGDGTGTGGGILLDKPTRSLMQLMFNKDIIVETMQMMKIDTEKLPLGNLSTTTLEQGSAILLEIQKLVNGAQQAGTKKHSKTNKGTDGPVDFTNAQKQQLLSLSNRFYSKVPQRIERGADASIAILDDMNKIAAQADLLRDLLDIVQTKNILDMSQQSTDPAAAHLQSLSTKFEHLPRGPELDAVRQYFTSTRGSTHDAFELLDVWRIARCNEAERFKPWSDDTNRKLLWHGSRLTNWVAILTQGLRIAPPEAPVSGYMFGKGIYFADMMSKSANYCRLYGATHGLMALAEVSLGKPHVLYDSDSSLDLHAMKKFGCRSTFALGRDGPAAFAPFPHLPGCTQGLQVPVYSRGDSTKVDDGGGASRRSRSLMYNEYIVYDVAQVHLRYLLRIKQA